eukprot:8272136-Lingulodinium_polyedra.AAC.1
MRLPWCLPWRLPCCLPQCLLWCLPWCLPRCQNADVGAIRTAISEGNPVTFGLPWSCRGGGVPANGG